MAERGKGSFRSRTQLLLVQSVCRAEFRIRRKGIYITEELIEDLVFIFRTDRWIIFKHPQVSAPEIANGDPPIREILD
jgi:hypothetical protein